MLAANIQYKYILSGKHLTLVIHKLCLANCQLWQLSTKNCQVWQLSASKLSGLTVVHLPEKLWQFSLTVAHLTVVRSDSCPGWQMSELTVVRADSCPSWQLSELTDNIWQLSANPTPGCSSLRPTPAGWFGLASEHPKKTILLWVWLSKCPLSFKLSPFSSEDKVWSSDWWRVSREGSAVNTTYPLKVPLSKFSSCKELPSTSTPCIHSPQDPGRIWNSGHSISKFSWCEGNPPACSPGIHPLWYPGRHRSWNVG